MSHGKYAVYSCVSFECLDSESLLSHSSNEVTERDSETVIDTMVPNEHERTTHGPIKPSLFQMYSSLPPQHPIRFIGLCAQVFLYYLVYGYLQVSLMETETTNSNELFCI